VFDASTAGSVRQATGVVVRALMTLLFSLISSSALAGSLGFGYLPSPAAGEKPAFMVTPSRPATSMRVVIEEGGRSHEYNRGAVASGQAARFEWSRDGSVTNATAWVQCEFADGTSEEVKVPFSWSFAAPLKVDLSHASADLERRVLEVEVTARVERAEIIAYGANKVMLDQSVVAIGAGPGKIEVPWVGDPSDVVLLDVKLHTDNAWAGFTFSPWFLDIPHDDVLFESNSDVIRPEEEHKLLATLQQLHDVVAKYGSLVPVKLYIAGCTDTVGSADHNRALSQRRARSIAHWLRSHGYSRPIFFHGFGESLLAVGTGDSVDEPRNRRALYMVGANPPPSGSGVPAVRWNAL
jgi:outer membrane protein OmpA-like peptidoglycan-associated protein